MNRLPATLDGMLELIDQRAPQTRIEPGLERVSRVLERLNPAFDATRIISVAGTNGKGSVVAFLEAIAARAGRTCLAYTSPHIRHFGERFRFGGAALGDDEIAAALQDVERARGDVALTWFEHVTLAGFRLASARRPDWLVAEVGMGGRLDAVNAVDADVAVITSIGLDHQEWLGRTRAEIAREKCGIARPGRPVVVAEKRPPAGMLALLDDIGAEPVLAGRRFDWRWRGEALDLRFGERRVRGVSPGLAGRHQAGNAAAAAAAALALESGLSDEVIAGGLGAAQLPGRFERVARDPDIIIDVAHNPAAARTLAGQLRRLPGGKIAVFSALKDKDIEGITAVLAPVFERWFAATLDVPRGMDAANLVRRMGALPAGGAPEALESVADALARARSVCRPGQTIVVFGSFMTAAAAFAAIEQCNAGQNSGTHG